MSTFPRLICLGASLGMLSGTCNAGVTLVNYDRAEYEISIQCKADAAQLEDIITANGMLNLEEGPCTITVKNGAKLVAADNEIVEIRNAKLALQ